MIAPLNWLKQYVNIKSDATTLADKLTLQAAEVEEIIEPNPAVKTALVAEVLEVQPHPNADRLRLAKIKVGTQEHTVVCGAPNLSKGQLTAYVPKGGQYYDHDSNLMTLAKATIRGVDSEGMLASEHDLGLSESHDGIMVLPESAARKKSLAAALDMTGAALKLEITPNRSDLFSIIGLAREISYFEKTRLNLPTPGTFNHHDPRTLIKPEVETNSCLRYCAIVLENFNHQESPANLAPNLQQAGIRPISAAVDVTNFVMLEYGQPLHAFDYDQIAKENGVAKILVRAANNGETFKALDGKVYTLTSADTVIADTEGVIALAGIIGGEKAAISANTKTVVLESAIFHPGHTRRTANRLGIRTESLTRFEKGIDPELQIIALKRATSLLSECAQAKPAGRLFDLNFVPKRSQSINISLDRIQQLVGVNFDKQFAKTALSAIGFQVTSTSQHGLKVVPPSWRLDVEREEDIVEELVRLYGYDKLPATLPASGFKILPDDNSEYELSRLIRRLMQAAGYDDIISQPFMSATDAKLFGINPKTLVEIANPTSRNEQYLRSQIVPLLLKRNAQESTTIGTTAAFELGHTFHQEKNKLSEVTHLGIAVLTTDPTTAARAIKGVLEQIGETCEKDYHLTFSTKATSDEHYLNGAVETIHHEDQVVGQLGVVSGAVTAQLKIKGERHLIAAEIDLGSLLRAPSLISTYQEASVFPKSTRDLSLSMEQTARVGKILPKIAKDVPLLKELLVVDEYRQQELRSLTIRLVFQAIDHTLTDQEITAAMSRVQQNINDCSEVVVRS